MVDSGNSTPVTERPIQSALSAMLRVSDGLLDLLPIATFICDARGTILQYNRHAVAVWGRAPQPGQTHEEFNQGYSFFRARWIAGPAVHGLRGAGNRQVGP